MVLAKMVTMVIRLDSLEASTTAKCVIVATIKIQILVTCVIKLLENASHAKTAKMNGIVANVYLVMKFFKLVYFSYITVFLVRFTKYVIIAVEMV